MSRRRRWAPTPPARPPWSCWSASWPVTGAPTESAPTPSPPGTTRTGLSGGPGSPSAPNPATVGRNPLGRVGEPEDPAAAIAFLAGPEARFITGADIVVDGGARTQLMVASGMGRTNGPSVA
ncbi:SDR family oxidoreductase [Phenylobacterium sp. J367]|uniref:SDR family oxidoreductase n=1 Tax=Phenylobacterium sp. J367 TaxID=2898435 RepID=UPI0035AEE8AC